MYPMVALGHEFYAGDFIFVDGEGTIADWHLKLVGQNMRFTNSSVDVIVANRNRPGSSYIEFEKKIGQATIEFKDNREDTANIENAAITLRILNHYLIQPGEEFSFNAAAGPYNTDKGYITGYSYSGNQKIPDVGGGVCKASTLLHMAVVNAGLPVLERHPHAVAVDYAERGMDAAVWEYVLDLVFLNDRANPLILRTSRPGERVISLEIWELRNN